MSDLEQLTEDELSFDEGAGDYENDDLQNDHSAQFIQDNTIQYHEPDYQILKIVKKDDRITSDMMTLFEFVKLMGVRQLQLQNSKSHLPEKIQQQCTSIDDIIIQELKHKQCPLILQRRYGFNNVMVEYINVNDLIINFI